jgi:hypothetical protein
LLQEQERHGKSQYSKREPPRCKYTVYRYRYVTLLGATGMYYRNCSSQSVCYRKCARTKASLYLFFSLTLGSNYVTSEWGSRQQESHRSIHLKLTLTQEKGTVCLYHFLSLTAAVTFLQYAPHKHLVLCVRWRYSTAL